MFASGRDILENQSRIDFVCLKAWGYLTPGHRGGTLNFSRGGRQTGSALFAVNIPESPAEENGFIRFTYSANGEPRDYSHKIELKPCHYGGHRFYFICKFCGRRVLALYLNDGYFACRHCLKLAYSCSNEKGSYGYFSTRANNYKSRAEILRRAGHPRRANWLLWKAEDLELIGLGFMAYKVKSMEEMIRRIQDKMD